MENDNNKTVSNYHIKTLGTATIDRSDSSTIGLSQCEFERKVSDNTKEPNVYLKPLTKETRSHHKSAPTKPPSEEAIN